MKQQVPRWISWAVVVTVFLGALYFLSISAAPPAPAQSATPNLPAPVITGTLLDGKPFNLADYKGKVVMLNFWGTWCPPCRAELPDVIALQKQYGSQNFTVIGLATNRDPRLNDAQYRASLTKFAAEVGINYPNLPNTEGIDTAYQIQAYPTTFLIDKNGTIVYSTVGMLSKDEVSQQIQKLL